MSSQKRRYTVFSHAHTLYKAHVYSLLVSEVLPKFLLEKAKNNDGDTPLHLSCRNENSTSMKFLVCDASCNPNEKNRHGDTALHVTCRFKDVGMTL